MAPHMKTKPQSITVQKIKFIEGKSHEAIPPSNVNGKAGLRFPRISASLRALKFQIVNSCLGWREPRERPKIAVYKDRFVALSFCLVHLPAFTGALTLIILNLTEFYVGREFTQSSQLQFVAKLHELLMQTSIGVILLQYIQSLACNYALPLGAILAPMQASNLSYLWSLELWSALTARAFPPFQKAIFAAVLPLAILFGAVVGPSSAVAMIPRPVTSPLIGKVNVSLNRAESDIFPEVVVNNITVSMNTASLNVITEDGSERGEKVTVISESSLRVDNEPRLLRVASSDCNNFSVSLATVPSQIGAAIIGTRAAMGGWLAAMGGDLGLNLLGRTFEQTLMIADILQPMVITRCNVQKGLPRRYDDSDITSSQKMVQIPNEDGTAQQDYMTLGELFSEISTQEAIDTSSNFFRGYLLLKPAPPDSTHSWITLYVNFALPTERLGGSFQGITACTTSAFWRRTTHTRSSRAGAAVIESNPPISAFLASDGCPIPQKIASIPGKKKISVEPTVFGDNLADVRVMLNRCANHIQDLYSCKLDQSLSMLTAKALSNLTPPPNTTVAGQDVEGLDSLQIDTSFWPESGCATCLNTTLETFEMGVGYGSWNVTVMLSLIVLIPYCTLVLAHVGWSLVTGICSTAWDSAASLMGLALQSQKPDRLGHVGVDMHCMETFGEMVGIRVNKEEELALVFVGEGEEGWKRVEENKGY